MKHVFLCLWMIKQKSSKYLLPVWFKRKLNQILYFLQHSKTQNDKYFCLGVLYWNKYDKVNKNGFSQISILHWKKNKISWVLFFLRNLISDISWNYRWSEKHLIHFLFTIQALLVISRIFICQFDYSHMKSCLKWK